MKFMASCPITSWQIDGETAETARDSLFLGSQITADGDWSHKIQRRLLLGRKAMSIQESILKIRDIALPTKVRLVKAMVFPVVTYGCEWKLDHKGSWAPKNWCFWTVVVKKTLESPLDCKEIQAVHPKRNQSWIFIGRSDAEIEALILCPSTSCEELTHWKRPWYWEGSKTGEEGDDRGCDGWMASLSRWTWVWVNSRSWWRAGKPDML